MRNFKDGDQVVRVKVTNKNTEELIPLGQVRTVFNANVDLELMDLGEEYAYYFYKEDFKLLEEHFMEIKESKDIITPLPANFEGVKAFRAKLTSLYALPRDKAFISRVTELISEFESLRDSIEEELPNLQEAIEETERLLARGEFTVAQFKKLISIAKVEYLDGEYVHESGYKEMLTLNARGAIRPPVDTWTDQATFNISDIEFTLRESSDVLFADEQALALLKHL